MSKDNFVLNNFRTKKIGEKILAVTDQGSWDFLTKKEFDCLMKLKPSKNLKEKGFIVSNDNFTLQLPYLGVKLIFSIYWYIKRVKHDSHHKTS